MAFTQQQLRQTACDRLAAVGQPIEREPGNPAAQKYRFTAGPHAGQQSACVPTKAVA